MRKIPDKTLPDLKNSERYLYGFKISARIKGFLERKRGKQVIIKWELVKSDGTLLTWLHEGREPMTLYAFYATWPDAKIAWTVYSKEAAQ